MRFQVIVSLFLLSSPSFAAPTPEALPQGTGGGADSCPSEDLTTQTWTKLGLDKFLVDAAKNYTRTKSNNVQSLARSFGAPNFFCGLDSFCNAGQPCLPITLPAWYAAVAIQNWNNYMNSLNTAITFASSILSLKLSSIVQDLYKDPQDNITPLVNIGKLFTTVISLVPFTGPVSTASSAITGSFNFVFARAKPPAVPNKFLAWSNIASSMADMVSEYQAVVSTTTTNIINAEIDDKVNGINGVLQGGAFLGVSQNFTQADLQKTIIDSITVYSIGLALQAQKIFIIRIWPQYGCKDGYPSRVCNSDGSLLGLIKAASNGNANNQDDIAQTLMDKYGMTKDDFLRAPVACYDNNGKKQLVNPFDTAVVTDPKAQCVFNVLICDVPKGNTQSIVDACRKQGLDI